MINATDLKKHGGDKLEFKVDNMQSASVLLSHNMDGSFNKPGIS